MSHGVQPRPEAVEALPVIGEFAFAREDFRQIAAILKREAGIDLSESKATLVYSRLTKRLRALSIDSFKDYCNLVSNDAQERHRMLSSLTTNVTSFFREPHHFEHLKANILAPLVSAARRGARIRLWSAACSSGEEPYSIALGVLSVIPDAANLDIKILATDINPLVLQQGRGGVYHDQDLQSVPGPLRSRWFEAVPGADIPSSRVVRELRSLVTFREFNLIGEWPMRGPFQAIFCRNVVIYFNRETQASVWRRIVRLIPEDGALYIGHSERVLGPASAVVTPDGITTYRKTRNQSS